MDEMPVSHSQMPKDVATALRTSIEECATICLKLQLTAAEMADVNIRLHGGRPGAGIGDIDARD